MRVLITLISVAATAISLTAPSLGMTTDLSDQGSDLSSNDGERWAQSSGTPMALTPVELPVMELSTQQTALPNLQISIEQPEPQGLPVTTFLPTGQRYGEPSVPYIDLTLAGF